MTNFYTDKVTIYNDIPSDGETLRRFDRFVLNCSIQRGFVSKADGTIQNIVNAVTVITKEISKYLSPDDYYKLSESERNKHFTVQVGDVIVFGEVSDIITGGKDFEQLQKKYANSSMIVSSVSVNIHGTDVDNISITNI